MASIKNVQALNNRLDLACRDRVDEFYRQHVSSMARLEHEKLAAARLLQSVKKCPSNREALSIKFLGPAPDSASHHHHQHHQQQRRNRASKPRHLAAGEPGPPVQEEEQQQERRPQRAPPQTAAPFVENPFAPPPVQQLQQPLYPMVERAKTFAADASGSDDATRGDQHQQQQQQPVKSEFPKRRTRTPFPNKLERFYLHLEDTKRSCGLLVVDSTQTDEARVFRGTLTRAEWRAKLAKLDPEYFKNLENEDTDESESEPDCPVDGPTLVATISQAVVPPGISN